jgi:hypothetical protein
VPFNNGNVAKSKGRRGLSKMSAQAVNCTVSYLVTSLAFDGSQVHALDSAIEESYSSN